MFGQTQKKKKKTGLPSYTTLKQLEICLPLNLHDKQRSVPCGQTWAISPPVIESGSTEQKKEKIKKREHKKNECSIVNVVVQMRKWHEAVALLT